VIAQAQPIAYSVLVVTAAILFWVAFTDLRSFKIPNNIVLVLVALFALYMLVSGRWVTLHWHIGFAAFVFVLLLVCYTQNWMGGGDVKLLTVAYLWTGAHCGLIFSLLMLAFALLHIVLVHFEWVQGQQVGGRTKVAFAPAIAGGLIGVFMSGCLAPM
jgi:prepilin peptidase CpaA